MSINMLTINSQFSMVLMYSSLSLKMELYKRLYLSSSVIKLCINALTAQMLIDKQTDIFISSNNLIFPITEK